MSQIAQNEIERGEAPVSELSVSEAISLAVRAHQLGHLDDAQLLYRRILDAAPEEPNAMHFLGVLLHQRDRSDEAVELIRRSIALDPSLADRHNNLGNVLVEREQFAEAAAAYRQAIALFPGHADAYNNLGALLSAQGKREEAAAAYLKAIEIDPLHAEARYNMGNLLSGMGRVKEAITCYCKALTLRPDHAESKKMLGIAYYMTGQIDAAAEVFRLWLAEEPDNPVAKHLYAASSGRDVPPRASNAYVESTFDSFADSFDAKLGKLSYHAPQLVADAVAAARVTAESRQVALDAGCGTGLCGPLLAPYVSRLIGVDLSSRMLDKARARGVYDELARAELSDYLTKNPAAFDLIVSADTLCYFGPLEAVLRSAHAALRPEGLLVFTVEEAPADETAGGYRINPHGRYSHCRAYIDRVVLQAGFAVAAIEAAKLRMEGGSAVDGLVVTARRTLTPLTAPRTRH
jgi:predicted TPR repeat methyltransferase